MMSTSLGHESILQYIFERDSRLFLFRSSADLFQLFFMMRNVSRSNFHNLHLQIFFKVDSKCSVSTSAVGIVR